MDWRHDVDQADNTCLKDTYLLFICIFIVGFKFLNNSSFQGRFFYARHFAVKFLNELLIKIKR